jgi:hypothetical protein
VTLHCVSRCSRSRPYALLLYYPTTRYRRLGFLPQSVTPRSRDFGERSFFWAINRSMDATFVDCLQPAAPEEHGTFIRLSRGVSHLLPSTAVRARSTVSTTLNQNLLGGSAVARVDFSSFISAAILGELQRHPAPRSLGHGKRQLVHYLPRALRSERYVLRRPIATRQILPAWSCSRPTRILRLPLFPVRFRRPRPPEPPAMPGSVPALRCPALRLASPSPALISRSDHVDGPVHHYSDQTKQGFT